MSSPIVVTGMGLVTPLGCGVEAVWRRLMAGDSGIRALSRFPGTGNEVDEAFPVRLAGLVPDIDEDSTAGLNPDHVLDAKERRKVDRFTLFAMAAAEQALTQAGWKPQGVRERQMTGTIVGSGIGGFPVITQAQKTLDSRGYRRISAFTVPAFLANMAAGNVSIRYGFEGPLGCPVTACAAGVQAIGDGCRLLRSGEAEVVLAGGAEACVDPLSLAGFHALKALATDNAAPRLASRPFDRDRTGFVMGEGAGLVVMETLEHALHRGAEPLAVISGYGTSADAYHITSGPPDGHGAAAAIRRALSVAQLQPEQVGYINAHATSTPVGDKAEIASLRAAFGEALPAIPISSTKSAIGHLLGAAGGVETIFCVMGLREQCLPPTLNLDQPDDEMTDLDLLPLKGRAHALQHAVCNGFGFGGVNASLVLSAC